MSSADAPCPSRRELVCATLGLSGLALIAGCGPTAATTSSARDVLAAGQPAALLIHALSPQRLIGWPRRPSPAALAFLPEASASLPETGALTGGGRPAGLEAALALSPRLVIDYGDLDPAYTALAERARQRLGVDYRLIDGALERTPEAFIQAGEALKVHDRAQALAGVARSLLEGWKRPPGSGPSFYYARGGDGLETAFAGALATEMLAGTGWSNVAREGEDLGRVSRERMVAWDAEVVVTLDAGLAARIAGDPVWRRRRNGARRRLLVLPDLPFGWIDRPPSINRLMGCAWLSGATPQALADLSEQLYGQRSTDALPMPRWID